MSVFQRVHMPSLDGATGWVKSDPPGAAGLRGHVVLVNLVDAHVHQPAAAGAIRARMVVSLRRRDEFRFLIARA